MRSQIEQQDLLVDNSSGPTGERELQILSEIENNPEVTQRALAQRVGIALGLTNLLLKSLAQKGYVRVAKATWKRRFYTLTPEGFSHRLGLLVTYVNRFLSNYRNVRQTLSEQLAPHNLHSESRIAICGTAEFAELVYLGLRDFGIEEVDAFETDCEAGKRFLGLPVKDISHLKPYDYDRVVIATLSDSKKISEVLIGQGASADHIVTFFTDKTKHSKVNA
jgi:DNA-binding MarR family transcriptional regulator